MFSRPKILFLVSLLFVALLNSIPTEFLLQYINIHMLTLGLQNTPVTFEIETKHIHLDS